MKSTPLIVVLGALLWLASASCLQAASSLVGNRRLAGQTLNASGVKAILLGKKATLGATRVIIVVIKSSAGQEAFLKKYLSMTTEQFQTHWRRLYMTGGGSAPKVVENEEEAISLLRTVAGAVAIVDSDKAGDLPVLAAD